MQSIYKYPLETPKDHNIEEHYIWKPLCIQKQNNVPTIWAEVTSTEEIHSYSIIIIGSGWNTEGSFAREEWNYIGTMQDGPFVWHYYYRENKV